MLKYEEACMKKFLLISVMLVLAFSVVFGSPSAEGRAYPARPIEIIVPFAAGGGTDAAGRAAAESLKGIFNQDVVVVNKTGGGGAVGFQDGLSAKPDGYTLILATRETVTLPLLGQAPFKSDDFRYIGMINEDPPLIVVPSTSKYRTIEELFAELKARPGQLNFAASVVPNYYGGTLTLKTGLTFVTIPNNGAAPAITELLGGRADFGIYAPGESKAQLDAGNLRPLAVMSETRFDLLPDVPTLKEKGYDVVSSASRGIAVSPKVPEEICKILEDAVAKVARDPKYLDFMRKAFYGVTYLDAAAYTKFVQDDVEVLREVIASFK
jgi:tripartite-type tricarboxylate transporter receptor subunit TctC